MDIFCRSVWPLRCVGTLTICDVMRYSYSTHWLKMTSDTAIRKLTARLRVARWRVRRLEMLLALAERKAVARCDHVWEKEYPSGPRDNGEYWYRCSKCSMTEC